jgi:riboflavin kinase/FMN adenylyltransferase
MCVLQSIEELSEISGPIFLAIGAFDGVHLGHKAVIERALSDAKRADGTAVAVTFDPHPARVLRPERAPRLLTATKHKLQLIENLGVTHTLVIGFTSEFAATPPEKFVEQLHACCKPLHEICVGHEWSFGRNRAGNLALLKHMGDELGFEEVGVPAVQVNGEIVSSTLIRAAVETGDLTRAKLFLGRNYSILGTVVRGDGLGRGLGFPTANLSAHNEQFPPNGVYAVEAQLGGRALQGVVNIGVRPTIQSATGERVLELHLLDFDEDIYGEDIEVFFRKFLRAEQKFSGLEELKNQIQRDAAAARTISEQ